jgi:hypothetical protein
MLAVRQHDAQPWLEPKHTPWGLHRLGPVHLKRILKLDRLRLRGANGAATNSAAQNLRILAKLIPATERVMAR